jgi:hypothetical protein
MASGRDASKAKGKSKKVKVMPQPVAALFTFAFLLFPSFPTVAESRQPRPNRGWAN